MASVLRVARRTRLPSGASRLGLLVGATVLMSWLTRTPEDSEMGVAPADEELLAGQMRNWMTFASDIDIQLLNGGLPAAGKRANGAKLLDRCLLDTVNSSGSPVRLSEVNGWLSVNFSQESVCTGQLQVQGAEGRWRAGCLNGPAVLTKLDGRRMEAVFNDGVISGVVRTYRCRSGSCHDFIDKEDSVPAYLDSIVVYSSGRPSTSLPAWWFPVGGGALHCPPGRLGLPDGEDCLYLYPDLTTALRGTWRHGVMKEARLARLSRLQAADGEPLISPVSDTWHSGDEVYSGDVSTKRVISSRPHLADPMEARSVYVAQSTIPNAGDGLFLRKNARPGDLVSVYNGVRMPDHESKLRKEDRKSPYRVYGWSYPDEVLNIPPEYTSLANYSASLGHKANHAKDASAQLMPLDHPRFGKVVGLYMIKEGEAGTEIFVDYGFVEKYMFSNKVLDTILETARFFTGYDKNHFNEEMKRTIAYVRDNVHHIRPWINTLKIARHASL